MTKSSGKFTVVLIVAFSFILVFGALFTVLAETGFNAPAPANPTPTTIQLDQEDTGPTAIVLPTNTTAAEAGQPVNTNKPTEEKTQSTVASKTPTITLSKSPTVTENSSCTVPIGWISYKIKSGDTLFSIAKLFQTTVPELQNANCMGSSTQIITGKSLWVPPNATLTPTKTVKPTTKPPKTPKPTTVTCYLLTLTHLGNGSDPVASPTNSSGCPTNKYKAGESISLSGAVPDTGWEINSWTGTSNDSSTAATNSLTMPAGSKSVKVNYSVIAPTCYALSVSSSANGGDPVASPTKSAACATTGEYVAGETISLTASPSGGYTVSGWSGTDNDASTSTSNTLTMPASATSVSVTYALIPPPCFTLTLSHTGTGSDPTAAPASSSGCSAGQFVAGETITLTASGGTVTSWTGTDDDASTASTNTLSMPAGPASASVIYTP